MVKGLLGPVTRVKKKGGGLTRSRKRKDGSVSVPSVMPAWNVVLSVQREDQGQDLRFGERFGI